MRVATCTPVDFEASPRFFSRDTGLLCRGFQAAGVDCVVVMPGARQPDDVPDLVRCSNAEIESPDWWRDLRLDLVVLYAWGHPKYLPVARAIRLAGIHLVQSMDTAGLPSPFADLGIWARCTWAEITIPQPLGDRVKRIARVVRDFFPSLFERSRLEMMNECDLLAAISPPARASIQAYAEALGRPDVAAKLTVVPHPVSPAMRENGERREDRLIVVGRWGKSDAAQKNPRLTLQILHDFLKNNLTWKAEIIGPDAEMLEILCAKWAFSIRQRLDLTNFLQHQELRERYATSKILLCSSRFESFHIASAEAVCCGCSVVVADHPLLASTSWFTKQESGTLARNPSASSLFAALLQDTEAWRTSRRHPLRTSEKWKEVLHADQVALAIVAKIRPIKKTSP